MLIRYILINDNVLQQKGRDMCKRKDYEDQGYHEYLLYIGLSLSFIVKIYPQEACTNTRTHFIT